MLLARLSPRFYCHLYPSSFKPQMCWLLSLTRITYLCKLIGTLSLAAFLHLEIYWVYFQAISSHQPSSLMHQV
ncbi:hypothetical protein B4916_01915 [Yersinia intermedia]|nr:hypothetical protein B4916_01915 [Yersinia intermedia]